MAEKQKTIRMNTPTGVLKYPKLVKPDYGTDEYPKADGEFNTKLVLSASDAAALIKNLEPQFKEAVELGKAEWQNQKPENRKKYPFKEALFYVDEYDEDGNETGSVIFTFKKKAGGVRKKDGEVWKAKPPQMFDAKGKPCGKDVNPWGGTTAKISFTTRPYFVVTHGAGISLGLEAIQIIDLVMGGERAAGDYGFGEEEGFEAADSFEDETADDDMSSNDSYTSDQHEDF